jgi:hypothetical protein
MPALANVHIDRGLTNISIAYRNSEYVADRVFVPLPVDKRSDKYFVYDREFTLRSSGFDAKGRLNSLVRPKAEADETDYAMSNSPFYCERYAKRHLVTDAERKIADSPIAPDVDATIHVTEKLMLDNEAQVAAIACNTTYYATANKVLLTTGGTGTSWAQYASANSKPLSDIKNGKVQVRKSIIKEPNAALYTVDTAQTLADHPDIKDLVKYTHQDALTSSGLPKVLRGLTTEEAAQQQLTSAEGAAQVTGNVWQDQNSTNICLIFYRSASAGPREIHFGRTFDAPDDTTDVRGVGIRRYRWEPKAGEYIEGSFTRDWRFIATDGSTNGWMAGGLAIGAYLISGATL